MKKVLILGAGAWGTALATLFACRAEEVILWAHEKEVADEINLHHTNNRFLPDVFLPGNVKATADLRDLFLDIDLIIEAIPMFYLEGVIKQLPLDQIRSIPLIITSKGIAPEKGFLPSQLFFLHGWSTQNILVCVGPTFAKEIVQKKHSGFLLASQNPSLIQEVEKMLALPFLTMTSTDDLIGVQVGGALKNVIALGVGMLMGGGGGENSRALALVKGFQEICLYAQSKGARKETLLGYAGLGDLVLTSMSRQSKNYRAGFLRGEGKSVAQIIEALGRLPEGCNTMRVLTQSESDFSEKFPFLAAIDEVFWQDKDPKYLERIF